jgi:hypothetical protein
MCIKFFCITNLIVTPLIGYMFYSSNKKQLEFESSRFDKMSILQFYSLPTALLNENVYLISLIATFVITIIAYISLIDFCNVMSSFEFQPDQQIMDQFIQLHTILIRGINTKISPESAERGIGKVFSQRFGHKNILKI